MASFPIEMRFLFSKCIVLVFGREAISDGFSILCTEINFCCTGGPNFDDSHLFYGTLKLISWTVPGKIRKFSTLLYGVLQESETNTTEKQMPSHTVKGTHSSTLRTKCSIR